MTTPTAIRVAQRYAARRMPLELQIAQFLKNQPDQEAELGSIPYIRDPDWSGAVKKLKQEGTIKQFEKPGDVGGRYPDGSFVWFKLVKEPQREWLLTGDKIKKRDLEAWCKKHRWPKPEYLGRGLAIWREKVPGNHVEAVNKLMGVGAEMEFQLMRDSEIAIRNVV